MNMMKAWAVGAFGILASILKSPGAERAALVEVRPDVIPLISELRAIVGLKKDDPAFTAFSIKYELKFYCSKEITRPYSDKPEYVLSRAETYAGQGFLLYIYGEKILRSDMTVRVVLKDYEPKVVRIGLICGDSEEKWRFGRWSGEMPKIELPVNPRALLQKHIEADNDVQETVPPGVIRRSIRFGGLIGDNASFPYGFVFEDDRLISLELLPQLHPKTIKYTDPAPIENEP